MVFETPIPHSWAKTRRGYWVIKRQTVGQRLTPVYARDLDMVS